MRVIDLLAHARVRNAVLIQMEFLSKFSFAARLTKHSETLLLNVRQRGVLLY